MFVTSMPIIVSRNSTSDIFFLDWKSFTKPDVLDMVRIFRKLRITCKGGSTARTDLRHASEATCGAT